MHGIKMLRFIILCVGDWIRRVYQIIITQQRKKNNDSKQLRENHKCVIKRVKNEIITHALRSQY